MSGHHKLGPSSAHRWLHCPGSVAATANDASSTSIYAAEGTAAHLCASGLLDGPDTVEGLLGSEFEIDGFTVEVDQAMLDAVGDYVSRCLELGPGYTRVEESVPLDPAIPGGHGTADFIHVTDGVLTVVDLKFGKGVMVSADSNEQALLYGYGALQLVDFLYDIDVVKVRIDQPRLDHVSDWETPVDELRVWIEEVVTPAAALAMQDDAPRIPGEKQCRWCTFKARCPELRELVADGVARLEHDGAEAAELSAALTLAGLASMWISAVQALAYERMMAGVQIDGFKLVHGRSSRSWADEAAAEKKLRRLLTVDVAMPRKLLSPPQAEKKLGKANWSKASGLVAVTPGKPTIAPDSDKRPAISTAESQGFDDISN